jgi:DNA repair protein RAD5
MDDTSHVDNDEEVDPVGASHLHGGWFGQEPEATEMDGGSEPPSEPLFLPEDDQVMERDSSPAEEVAKVFRKRPSPSPGESPRPSKRRRLSNPLTPKREIFRTEAALLAGFYLGEVIIDNAYSLVSGKDAIKPGEKIWLYRDKYTSDPIRAKSNPSTKPKDSKSTLKQLTLTSLSKKPTASTKPDKKKVDHIVYIINSSKRQIGRVPVDVGAWVSVLMDADMAWFTGTVIDVPSILRMGNTILVSLRVYITPTAFTKPTFTNSIGGTQTMFNEGAESVDEVILREKKASLLRLFSVLSLRPRQGAPNPDIDQIHSLAHGAKEQSGISKKIQSKGVSKVVKTELIGEGEDAEEVEVEGDDEEVLSTNQLDVIYQKLVVRLLRGCWADGRWSTELRSTICPCPNLIPLSRLHLLYGLIKSKH